jgi:hypothetical protein
VIRNPQGDSARGAKAVGGAGSNTGATLTPEVKTDESFERFETF